MKIGIAGCGGIGSNVAMFLVRAGVENFKLVDFDKIEESNLNRQFYFKEQIGKYKAEALKENLLKIDKFLTLENIVEKISIENVKNIFNDCDIIVEAFDKKEYKILLIEHYRDKMVVCANGIGGRDLESIIYKKIGNVHIYGDFYSDISKHKTYSTKVSIVAAMMANKILDYLEKTDEQ